MALQGNPRSNLIQEQLAINQILDKLHSYTKKTNKKLQQIMIMLLAIKNFPWAIVVEISNPCCMNIL